MVQSVAVTSGDMLLKRRASGYYGKWDYKLREGTNYNGVNLFTSSDTFQGNTANSNSGWTYTPPVGGLGVNDTVTRTGFFQVAYGNVTMNNASIVYTNETPNSDDNTSELVHQDIHTGINYNDVITKLGYVENGGTGAGIVPAAGLGATKSSEVLTAFKNAAAYTNDKTVYTGASAMNNSRVLPFINSGDVIMEGKLLSFSNSYDHGNTSNNNVAGLIINTGTINTNPYFRSATNVEEENNAIFVISPEILYSNIGNQQTYYNSGKVNTWNKKTGMFLFLPTEIETSTTNVATPRPVNVVNTGNGEMNMYGEKSTGIYVKTKINLDLNFTDATTSGTTVADTTANGSVTHTKLSAMPTKYNPLTIYGDSSTGLYVPQDSANEHPTQSKITGYFGVSIGDTSGKSNEYFTNTAQTTQGTVITSADHYSVNSTNDTPPAGYIADPVSGVTPTTTYKAEYQGRKKTLNTRDIQGSTGIYSFGNLDLQGHEISIYGNTDGNVGVYSAANVTYDLGKGKILLQDGKNNTALVVPATGGRVVADSDVTLTRGIGNMAIYAIKAGSAGSETVKIKTLNSSDTVNAIGIYADSGAYVKVTDGVKMLAMGISSNPSGQAVDKYGIKYGGENTGAVYAKGGAEVDINRTALSGNTWDVDVKGEHLYDYNAASNSLVQIPKKYVGFGLFADGAKIDSKFNKIKVEDGSTAVASINANSKVDLTNSIVYYSGEGYALYTSNGGKIILDDGTLQLSGKAIGYVNDLANPGVHFNSNSKIDVQSDDVIVTDLKNGGSPINLTITNGTPSLKDQVLGTGVNVISTTGATRYKYAVVDGATININGAIDEANKTVNSDSEVFTKRLLYQNSVINVNANVKANLNTTELNSIDKSLTVPVGIAISASGNSLNNASTQINNNSTVEVNRTDSGNGGVGLYANYGQIKNNAGGVINVETTKNNPNAVGIYGTNSTPITNDGVINVGGKNSFGILGLSYRLKPSGVIADPTEEAFYANASGTFGKVDIVNNKNITMNGDSSLGIYVFNNSSKAANAIDQRPNTDVKATNNAGATITMNGSDNSIGMAADKGTLTNAGTINVNGTVSAGMYATDKSSMENASTGIINVAATTAGSESIGMFTQDVDTPITTSGTINVGKNSYGIYGRNVNMTGGTINVDDSGLGIYSTGPNIALTGGTINVGNDNAVGVYAQDDKNSPSPAINITGNVNMNVGNNQSFGYSLITNRPVNLTTGAGTTATVGDKSVYIYSASPIQAGSLITNNSTVNTTGSNGYAIYSLQDAVNNRTLNLGSGVGNIGLYSTGGTITNTGTINVGPSNTMTKEFGIGMATGYFDETTGAVSNRGTVVNRGVINVTTPNSIGMYAVGAGSKAINETSGIINLSGANTVGMYIDQGATGINYGTIKTVATGSKMKGVILANGGILKNYGNIEITGPDTMGVYSDGTGSVSMPYAEDEDSARGVTGHNNSDRPIYLASATDEKPEGSVVIKTPPKANPQSVMVRKPDGTLEPVAIENVDTNAATPNATLVEVRAGDSTLLNDPFRTFNLKDFSQKGQTGEITSLAMYVDTSGINFTHPIQGLHYLSGLTDINLIVGVEATQYSNAKAIEIGDNILKPYNDALTGITGTLNVNSSSLTWLAQPVRNLAGSGIDRIYLVKVPYTDFASAKDPDTKNFLDGLEQRYGADTYGDRGAREKLLFNKLNDIGKGETHIFAQAVNEMKGYQYSNTQQRINETGSLLDKEFSYLQDQWRNPSKDSNKIKVFGMRNEYNTDTAGVIDNESNAYGVAYVHEKEDVRMGHSQGWYAGAVNNHYKFKDLGGSRENQTMVKAGVFKTMSPAKDHNGALQWTIAGDVFAGRNEMKRRFWIVDDTFNAKSDYYSYGAALKTDLGYDIRTSERTHLRPYGALKVEYGRFTDIKEDDGEIRLTVDGNDYISVKPEVGVEFKYVQPMALKTNLSVGLTAAYTDELGKVNELNKAKVRYTTADWYNLKNEKEDRKGSGKFDLNIGIDNTRFGVTVNAGYDTKGENVRGGLGFRLIY